MERKPKSAGHDYDVAIIGAGITGLSAALYAGRFRLKTLVLGDIPRGTITTTDKVENYPGFDIISGIELAEKVKAQAEKFGAKISDDKVTSIEKCAQIHDGCGSCFKVYTNEGHYHAKSVIFATGTKWKELNVPGEKEFFGRGVHNCALCDGYFYSGKTVAVVGGSDSAAKEALLLSEYAKKVYIIYRGQKIRPEPITLEMVEKNTKIEIISNTQVKEIVGDSAVNAIILDMAFKGSTKLSLDGVFVDIGHVALSELAIPLGVQVNQKGEIIADRNGKTNVPGVFAAGDVVESDFKQAITGAAQGVLAAYSVYKYVTQTDIICILDDEDYEE